MYAHPANIYVKITDKEWFITNPVHQTGDIVDASTRKYLTRPTEKPPGDSILDFLCARGYLVESPLSLPKVYRALPTEKASTLSVSIGCTSLCNLQCTYCFQKSQDKKSILNTEKVDKLIQCLERIKHEFLVFSPSQINWELTGGEPLLPSNHHIIQKLLDYIGPETPVSITTNGTHVSDFVPLLSSYRVLLRVTLDGTPSIHNARRNTPSGEGTYSQIVEGINEARKAGMYVFVKTNVDPRNAEVLRHLADMFDQYGWTEDEGVTVGLARVRPTPTYSTTWTATEFVEHLCPMLERHNLLSYFDVFFPGSEYFDDILSGKTPEISRYRCRLDRNFFFSPDGLIYPCIRMNSYPIGRFFPEYSANENQLGILKSRTVLNIPSCMECEYALICRGGCPAESLERGSLFNGICEDYPRILSTYIPYRLRALQEE
ncbi:MAG: radical SAM protein [Theionarchaea archaeon]|nr:radical SAM protein [Theionarchaea archaeon]